MKTEPVWRGTQEQAIELADAVAHNCACELSSLGARVVTCAPHAMIEDQRTLDGLAFGRYIAQRLMEREFGSAEVVNPV